jgi:hypothetical protein
MGDIYPKQSSARKAFTNFDRVVRNVALAQQNGAPEAEIDAYLSSEGYTPERFVRAYENAQKAGGKVADVGFGATLANSLFLNFGDEAVARFNALRGEGTYEQNLAAYNLALDEYSRQYPGRALTAEIAGAALPIVATLGAGALPRGGVAAVSTGARLASPTARAIPLISQVKTCAKVGALTGAISGAGAAQPGQRTTGATIGGLTGAVAGPGTVILLDKVGRPIGRYLGGKVLPYLTGGSARVATVEEKKLAQQTMDKFNAELNAAGFTPEQAYQLIARAEAAGAPRPQLPDVIRQLQALRNQAASQSGRAGQETLDVLRERQKLQPAMLAQSASRESGTWLTDVPLANQAGQVAARQAADPLYEALRANPNFTNNQLALMFQNRANMKEAFDFVKRNMTTEDYTFQSNYETGVFNPNELNEIAKYMSEASFALSKRYDDEGAKALKRSLDNSLEAFNTQASKNIPEWLPAREAFKKELDIVDARKLGTGFLDAPPAEAADRLVQMRKLSPEAQQGFKESILADFNMRLRQKADYEGLASADVSKSTLRGLDLERLRQGLGTNLEETTRLAQELEKQTLSRQSLDKALLVKPEVDIGMERVSGVNIPRSQGGVFDRLLQGVQNITGEEARQREAARVKAEADRLTQMFNTTGKTDIGKLLAQVKANEQQRLASLTRQGRTTTAAATGAGLLSAAPSEAIVGGDYTISPDLQIPEETVLDAGNVYGRPPGMPDEEWNAILKQRGLLSQ